MNTREEIVKKEIKEWIDKSRFAYKDWYVGIAVDPEKRLFIDHKVERESWWIYRNCYTSIAARSVEEYFVDQVCTDGNPGGGDLKTKFTYAYKKTEGTSE